MTSVEPRWAVDTSVAVAALDQSHQMHTLCRAVVIARRPALAGHAAFETFSVLTRLPGALRVDPADAARILSEGFPEPCWLDVQSQAVLLGRLGALGLAGGSVYDVLVASAAKTHGRTLLSRDARAERTYRRIGVDYEWVGERE